MKIAGSPSKFAPPRFAVALTAVLIVVTAAVHMMGCGLIQGMQDNECGGDGLLEYDGEYALPGDPCGPCNEDILVCGDDNELTCEPGNTRCDAPANFDAESTTDTVELTWEHVENAAEYRLSRDGEDLATVEPDGATPGDALGYTDDDADPGRHAAPADLELSVSGDRREVTLSWTTPDSEPGTTHDYELVAYYEQPQSHQSSAVYAEAGRLPGDNDGYEYRWGVDDDDPADWSSDGIFTSGDEHMVDHDVDPAQWPEVSVDSLQATDGDGGWDVELLVEDATASVPISTFEVRAVSTDSGESVGGEAASETWQPDVEGFSVEWLRKLPDEDEDDFESLAETDDIGAEQTSDGKYAPESPLEFADKLPELPDEYTYRAVLKLQDYYQVGDEELQQQVSVEAEDTGYRGKPAVFVGASETGASWRIDPDGEGKWDYDTDQDAVHATTAGPDTDVYIGTASFGSESTVQESLISLDSSDGTDNWEVSWPNSRIVDLELCEDNVLIVAEDDATISRVDSTDGSRDDIVELDDTSVTSIAVDSSCNVFTASDDAYVRHISFDDDSPYWQHTISSDEDGSMSSGQLGVTSAGHLIVAATHSSALKLHILDPQNDSLLSSYVVPEEEPDHNFGAFNDLVVDHKDRIYVAFHEWRLIENAFDTNVPAYEGYIHVYEYDDFSDAPNKLAAHHHPAGDWGEDGFFSSAMIHTLAVDPLGHLYYGTRSPGERVYQLPGVDTKIADSDAWSSPNWDFDEYSTPNPNPDNQDPDTGGPEDCLTDPDEFSCVHVRDITVSPGSYAAFPDAWDDVLDRLDDSDD